MTAAQQEDDFWQNQERAQSVVKELAVIEEELAEFDAVEKGLADAAELAELAEEEGDGGAAAGVEADVASLEKRIESRERELRFDGPHDRAGAIVTVQSGAGGTDAQDWAQMLERMYLRLAERRGWKALILDRSAGEEAGIKHVAFELDGKLVYGLLRGEHGVHRLVRQSPFNADKLRQTSFARVEVVPKLEASAAPEIDAKDLHIDTYRASGAGGQHVNKTDSAVRIRHVPTGIVVQCQNERSQAQNKAHAMTLLQSKLQHLAEQQQAKELKDIKGETKEAAWGNQIRSYVLHPYTLVKDHRSNAQVRDVQKVLDGDLETFMPHI